MHNRISIIALIACGLLAASAVASSHDVRNSDGTPFDPAHVHEAEVAGGVRMLGIANSRDMDCESATWPHIPPRCLEPTLEKASSAGVRQVN